MLYPQAQTIGSHLGNAAAAVIIGLLFAFIGLNAATGCGQGGQCIGIIDLHEQPTFLQISNR